MTGPLELPGMPARRPATFREARCEACGAHSLYQYRVGGSGWVCAPCASRSVAELRGALLPWAERHILAEGIAAWLELPPLAEWPELQAVRHYLQDEVPLWTQWDRTYGFMTERGRR